MSSHPGAAHSKVLLRSFCDIYFSTLFKIVYDHIIYIKTFRKMTRVQICQKWNACHTYYHLIWWLQKYCNSLSSSASKLKNAKWNCKCNSGHIYKLNIGPKSLQLYLSNPCKNTQKDQEMALEIM